jgi:hypothetical protein
MTFDLVGLVGSIAAISSITPPPGNPVGAQPPVGGGANGTDVQGGGARGGQDPGPTSANSGIGGSGPGSDPGTPTVNADVPAASDMADSNTAQGTGCPTCHDCPHCRWRESWPIYGRQPTRDHQATSRKYPVLTAQPVAYFNGTEMQVARCTDLMIVFGVLNTAELESGDTYTLYGVALQPAPATEGTYVWTQPCTGLLMGMTLTLDSGFMVCQADVGGYGEG